MTVRTISLAAIAAALVAAAPAQAEDAPASPFTITGTIGVFSQYRLRGISQTDEDVAVQGSLTVAHSSGFYASTWGSNLAGFGTFGGSNVEVDAIVGYGHAFGSTALDGGLIWYLYPGTDNTDYAEAYGSISHPFGPVKGKLGFNYAPKQEGIGDKDNLWVYSELALPVPSTPVTLKGHVGYTTGKGSFLAGPDGDYFDFMVGADFTWKNLTLNVSYVDTDIGKAAADSFYSKAGFKAGHKIAGGTALVSLTAAF